MKTIITLCITIIFLSFSKISIAQLQEHYHFCSVNVSVPIVIDYLKVTKKKQEEKKEHIPDKQISIGLQISVQDMRVEGNSFSGMSIYQSAAYDDIKTFYGEVSEDKKMIKHLVLTQDYILYSIPDRERGYVEDERNILIEIENIPLKFASYKYEEGVSKIINLKYNKKVFKKHYFGEVTETESFVKLNDGVAYGPSGYFNFTPGVAKLEPVTHLTIEGPDSVCRGVAEERSTKKKPCKVKLIAKSDITGGSFEWECDSEAILFNMIEGKDNEIYVRALVDYLPTPESVSINVTQKVGAVEFSATHVLQLHGGYYYFWPDCSELEKLGIITKKEWNDCFDDLDRCEDSLKLYNVSEWDEETKTYVLLLEADDCNRGLAVEYLDLILQEHLLSASGLVNPAYKLDSEKLNWFYKLWDENGNLYPEEERAQPREFVKQFPCMEKWVKLGNKNK